MNLGLRFTYELERSQGTDWITITLWPSMTETSACLLDLGLVTEADLVTYRQLHPEDYAQSSDFYEDAVYDTGGEAVTVYGTAGSAAVFPA